MVEGVFAALSRRGDRNSGAVFIRIDRLDGRVSLLAPALPSSDDDAGHRRFEVVINEGNSAQIDDKMAKELQFDPDLWLIDVEDRQGRSFVD